MESMLKWIGFFFTYADFHEVGINVCFKDMRNVWQCRDWMLSFLGIWIMVRINLVLIVSLVNFLPLYLLASSHRHNRLSYVSTFLVIYFVYVGWKNIVKNEKSYKNLKNCRFQTPSHSRTLHVFQLENRRELSMCSNENQ